jgi:hypothetical protein
VTYRRSGFIRDDRRAAGRDKESEIRFRRVSPDFFRTLRIPLVEGREFSDADWSPVATTVIVNRAFANAHFPNASPIGHRIQWSEWKDLEIIGVVADARERPDGEIQRSFYLPIDAAASLATWCCCCDRIARPRTSSPRRAVCSPKWIGRWPPRRGSLEES